MWIIRSTPQRAPSDILTLLLLRIDNVHKLGLQRCTTYKEPIDVRLRRCPKVDELNTKTTKVGGGSRTKFLAIRCSDRAPIDDPCRFGDTFGHLGFQKLTNLSVRFLGLRRGGNLARTDRPHRLICDHDLAAKRNSGSLSQTGRRRGPTSSKQRP